MSSDLDLAVSTPRRGQRLPRCRRPARRRPALRPRPDLGARRPSTSRARRSSPSGRPARRRRFQLDLGPRPHRRRGRPRRRADRLRPARQEPRVRAPIEEDQRYELSLDYVGTPEPAPAPTTRSDFSTTGFTVTDTGEVWTMQEPYGAYTWYPVNDQPSDKALYDITVHAPARVDRHLQRRAHGVHQRRRGHDHVVAARRAGVVVPHHPRDRRLRPQQQHLARAGCGSTTGRRAAWSVRSTRSRPRPRRSTGSRPGSATTPSTPSASSSPTRRARWRPRRWSRSAPTTTSSRRR